MYITSFQRTRGKLLSTKTRETPPKTGRVGEERGMQGPTLERGSESAGFRPKLAALIRGITRHPHSARNPALRNTCPLLFVLPVRLFIYLACIPLRETPGAERISSQRAVENAVVGVGARLGRPLPRKRAGRARGG